jgi:ATPase subunit of ABC transporter with duplicated ATPase domains
MSTQLPTSVVCTDVNFSWPDGEAVFDGLTTTFGEGRSGLIGVNGSGKSTLLKLVAGALRPTTPWPRSRGRCWWRATTCPSCARWASLEGSTSTAP